MADNNYSDRICKRNILIIFYNICAAARASRLTYYSPFNIIIFTIKVVFLYIIFILPKKENIISYCLFRGENTMKNTLKWLGKCIAAGCVAAIIACAFSFFYYNIGRHSVNPNGATDYLWDGNTFYCQLREGFAFGKTDADGFNNAYPGVTSDADILIMGSSHMEAAQVAQNQSTAYMLNKYLDENSSELRAYNIGLSSHHVYRCMNNFEAALETYSPSYIIIETDRMPCEEKFASYVLNGTLDEVPSYEGLLYKIQGVPLPRILLQQLREYQNGRSGSSLSGFAEFKELLEKLFKSKDEIEGYAAASGADSDLQQTSFGPQSLKLFDEISAKASQHGAEIIIVIHTPLWLSSDGTASVAFSDKVMDDLHAVCSERNITVIDMGDRFLDEYNENHIMPYGFSNSSAGEGHLNAHGHRMMAQELYKVISEMQGASK